ncbi:MAG: AAA family ATPase [Oscillospiraceae bacterium]|nr:AAA family ATPase [Oscillospiraceae bacterium]
MDGDQERFFPFMFYGKPIDDEDGQSYIYKIRPQLMEALKEVDLSDFNPYYEEGDYEVTDVAKNTILYGPPGTGKTYNTVVYAVAIIENKTVESIKSEAYSTVFERYCGYKTNGLIEFTTFHQSYGYEEFIEGIKPILDGETDEQSDVKYTIEDGLFKAFCNKSSVPVAKKANQELGLNKTPTIWKVSLWSTGDNPTRTECLENGHIRIGWDDYGAEITEDTDFSEQGGKKVLNAFISRMKIGDIVFSCYSSTTIDAIGVVTGEYEWCGEQYDDGLNRRRKVNWIVKGINEDIVDINGGSTMTLSTVYRLKNIALSDAMAIIEKYLPQTAEEKKNHVFIIDEINRGNISKIFGELITLIEPSKRLGQAEGMKAKLPYSQQLFGVPDNVYIIGTMNTADRSIATIDTALRRRFRFKEMMPDSEVLKGISVEDISISEMLSRMNKRIAVLYDREHTVGHAYFIPLRDNPTVEQLAEIFENAIVPLLQEYFYEDYEKIRLVLGDNNKENKDEQFIIATETDYEELFGSTDVGFDDSVTYEINKAAFGNIDAYRKI